MYCNVFMLEYRGYGKSEGKPDQNGILKDADAGLRFIQARADLSESPIVLYGQSIGGAVAVALAAKNFDAVYPLFPLSWLI
jgi:fermentation-respiration switch protein FrsA (DUF1100 family)